MRRRTLLAGTTAAAGLTALGTAVLRPSSPGGSFLASSDSDRTVPRVLAERSSTTGLVRPELRCDAVAVTGEAKETAIRFETADGVGAWRSLHLHAEGRDDRGPSASALVRAPAGTIGYETRAGEATAAVNLRDGEGLRLGGSQETSLSADSPDTARSNLRVPFLTRAGWGADESLRFDEEGNDLWEAEFSPVQALTVHHTAMATGDDYAADVRAVYHLHAVEQAWGDIGYHVLIDPDGVLYEGRHSGDGAVPVFSEVPSPGRARSVTGGHAYGFNQGNVGVCLLGDFTDEPPTQAAQDSLVNVLSVLCAVTGLRPAERVEYVDPDTGEATANDTISRHRDWLSTECPGDAFAEVFDDAIRQRVVEALS